ncbi:rhodanese-like domain-containing protein [Gammaproteobacteria bacterium]|jgi:rhodanese-related sulfurtransferase|nr:rhodanese-like domain-containing protein [Gammaproteobacteria bacterium]|tara:strand:+ start:691 stop:1107 length:417 start_codon:yes stop_codon:yes gene_type:complete
MLEFNLFLYDYWYLSVPLFLSILLWFRAESRRGGNRVDCQQLTKLVNKESACLIDVRPRQEFEDGTIAGAINMPFEEVDLRHDELLKMKDLPIVLICAMGRNAGLAGEKLQKHGYSETHVLRGGLATWQQDGLPLVKI